MRWLIEGPVRAYQLRFAIGKASNENIPRVLWNLSALSYWMWIYSCLQDRSAPRQT